MRPQKLILILLSVGALAWGLWAFITDNPQAGNILTLAALLVAVLAVLFPLGSSPGTASDITAEKIESYATTLAEQVRKVTQSEAVRRDLVEGDSIRIPWRLETRRNVPALPASGYVDDLVEVLAAPQGPKRLVVIGGSGSGKTSLGLLLTLARAGSGNASPIPVSLALSSWGAGMSLRRWMSHRLVTEYGFLGNEGVDPKTGVAVMVEKLLERQRLLPIFDGLDELPPERHAATIQAIVGSGIQSFAITCRAESFEAHSADGMRAMPVVRLLPVEAGQAADYLRAYTESSEIGPLLEALAADPGGELAAVLGNPLMLYLTRAQYRHDRPLPAELVATGTRPEIERFLIAEFIPAVFRPAPDSDEGQSWDPEAAARWLGFLAAFLERQKKRDLAWWELYRSVPRWVTPVTRFLFGGTIFAVLCRGAFGVFGMPTTGLVLGFVVGAIGGLLLSLAEQEGPRQAAPAFLRRVPPDFVLRSLGFGAICTVPGGVIVALLFDGFHYVIIDCLAFGVSFFLARLLYAPALPTQAGTPDGFLRNDRATVFYAWGIGGAMGIVVGAFLGLSFESGLAQRVKDALGPNPWLFELATWQQALLGAAAGLILGMTGIGLTVMATSAWGRFTSARLSMALRGRTPLRLMRFLDDAYDLGILRRSGPYYQFRHDLLADHLTSPGVARPVADPQPQP
ncbi:hypothetical protein Aph01nite_11530 [Acrocarpospora phusangensis]|uniref:NACHT domain-containing protein n=1 Tax=Acrocarpospora phusangensis TaxID=1070424 RepID=A0A919Q8J8_9ACTN|nr:hypothetical protein [Acrocarpospora phusangensis]GIH22843.1 hypothetical protein Aph01nite_11530 [Acrocarpospora phusangensis]